MRRQLARDVAAQLADLPVQAVADRLQFEHAARQHAVLALEAERQADVHQLEHGQVLDRIARQVFEQLEELLATEGLVVEGRQQAHLRPGTLVAPGRGHHRLVDHGAQHVARGHHLAAVHAFLQGAVLEQLDRHVEAFVERVEVLRGGRGLQPHHFREQQRAGGHQRVEADVEDFRRAHARGMHHALFQLLEARRGEVGERAARRGAFSLAVEDDGGVLCFPDHVQLLIAQNFSSSPAKSPDTWKAKPPELSSCASSSALNSRAK